MQIFRKEHQLPNLYTSFLITMPLLKLVLALSLAGLAIKYAGCHLEKVNGKAQEVCKAIKSTCDRLNWHTEKQLMS